jgi:hypothetical protein
MNASVSSNASSLPAPRMHAVRVAPPRLGSSLVDSTTMASTAAATPRRVHFSPDVTIAESAGQAGETFNTESNIRSLVEARPVRAKKLRYFEVIVDSGCAHSCTPYMDDFIAGTLKPYHSTVTGIAGELKITHIGVVRYELLDDNFNVVAIETSAYLVPAMKDRLFSPQACLRELTSKPHNGNDKFTIHMTSDSMEFRWLNGRALTVHYRPPGFLPTFRVFRDAPFIAKHLARSSPRTMMSAERRMLLRSHMQGVLVDKIARGLPKRAFRRLRDHRF